MTIQMKNEPIYHPIATGSKIVVKLASDEQLDSAKKNGLIIIDSTSNAEMQLATMGTIDNIGTVAFSGFQRLDPKLPDESWYKVGDKVCFTRYAGIIPPVECNGQYRVMNDIDIYCKLVEVKENAESSNKSRRADKS